MTNQMTPEERKQKDEAMATAQREWWELEEQHPEATALASFFVAKHVGATSYRALGRIIGGKGEYANSV